jgi:hypothetical protein
MAAASLKALRVSELLGAFSSCLADEAIEVLAHLQAGGNRNDPLVVAEWEEITQTLAIERAGGKGWRKFVENGMWKRTVAGFTVQMWQQNSGANVMVSSSSFVS